MPNSSWFSTVCCQRCRIQRCNAEYVASFSPSGGLQEEVLPDVDYCIALRAYSLCTRRTAHGCRGDLVYHSAVFRIKSSLHSTNCSSDGPRRRPKHPALPSHQWWMSATMKAGCSLGPGGPTEKVRTLWIFGDPHLRTFRDEFQTCRVEGAWPLIHNRYLSVQVTNVPVVEGSSATATNKVSCENGFLLTSSKCDLFQIVVVLLIKQSNHDTGGHSESASPKPTFESYDFIKTKTSNIFSNNLFLL